MLTIFTNQSFILWPTLSDFLISFLRLLIREFLLSLHWLVSTFWRLCHRHLFFIFNWISGQSWSHFLFSHAPSHLCKSSSVCPSAAAWMRAHRWAAWSVFFSFSQFLHPVLFFRSRSIESVPRFYFICLMFFVFLLNLHR